MRLRSPSAEATFAAGRRLGEALRDEDAVLGLVGPLGAGKTLFVKGLAAGLGLDPGVVASPTFVIASEYPLPGGGGRRLVHVDCYRLERVEELENAGWLDWLPPGSVVAVEWPDRIAGVLPPEHLRIEITRGGSGDSQRWLNAIASGSGAEGLLARWRAAVEDSPELEPAADAPAP